MGDVDGDGDLDVVMRANHVWINDGKGQFQRGTIPKDDPSSALELADLDGDGDLDLITNAEVWLNDGQGHFREQRHIFGESVRGRAVGDIDGDGDLDALISTRWNTRVLFNADSPQGDFAEPGDANRDGQFDQEDIVQVLQAAKYLTGESATFAEGDWNVDGVFDQLDIVAALQADNYSV